MESRIDLETYQSTLGPIFSRHQVVAAYLFGSQAEGRVHQFSDIDFATLLPTEFDSASYTAHQLDMTDELSRVLKFDLIDVAVLNNASLTLKYQVLRHGIVIFCQAHNARVAFEVDVITQYQDMKWARETYYDYQIRRLKEGRFGKQYRSRQSEDPLERHRAILARIRGNQNGNA